MFRSIRCHAQKTHPRDCTSRSSPCVPILAVTWVCRHAWVGRGRPGCQSVPRLRSLPKVPLKVTTTGSLLGHASNGPNSKPPTSGGPSSSGPGRDRPSSDPLTHKPLIHSFLSRSAPTSAPGGRTSEGSGTGIAIFDRVVEYRELEGRVTQSPTGIVLLLGPRSCGKSTLMKYFTANTQLDKTSVCYMDGGAINLTKPAGVAAALISRALTSIIASLQQNAPQLLSEKFSGVIKALSAEVNVQGKLAPGAVQPEFLWSAMDFRKQLLKEEKAKDSSMSDLQAVLDAYMRLLSAWAEARAAGVVTGWPVIVIDEADILMGWNQQYRSELGQLVRWFVYMTKQTNSVHIILASAESSLLTWADKELGVGFWEPVVVGNFTKDIARQFFEKYLGACILSDCDWEKVYEVCGGNAGMLRRAKAAHGRMTGRHPQVKVDWDVVLRAVWVPEMQRLERASNGGDGYTHVQFADAALLLLENNGVVQQKDMKRLLGRHASQDPKEQQTAGGAVLDSMVRKVILSIRPYSRCALDLPTEAYGPSFANVITTVYPTDLYCLRKMKTDLEADASKVTDTQQ